MTYASILRTSSVLAEAKSSDQGFPIFQVSVQSRFNKMHQRKSYTYGASSPSSSQQSRHEGEEGGQSPGLRRGKFEFYNGDEMVFCDCQEPYRRVTSWTLSNPGRRFHGCKNYGTPNACKYFLWYDPPMPEMKKNMMAKLLKELREAEQENYCVKTELARLEEENKMMKREIRKLKDGRKVLVLALVCCSLVLSCIVIGSNKERQSVKDLGFQMLP